MKTVYDSTDWKGTNVFSFVFSSLVPGILAGFGMFYIETIILQNSLNRSLFFSLVISTCITSLAVINQTRKLSHRLEERGGV